MIKIIKNNYKGITLISLVITIVIMLILAAVSINLILGDNGLFGKAKLASQKYKEASNKENAEIGNAESSLDDADPSRQEDPVNSLYVSNPNELKNIISQINNGEDLSSKTIIISNDIDLSDICSESKGSLEPIGNSTYPFKGNVNGKGHEIKNLYINKQDTDNIGLFGVIDNATIKNVNITGTVVAGKNNVAGIAGFAKNSIIENCINKVNVTNVSTSNFTIGGIAGRTTNTSVKNCKNYGNIENYNQQAAGIVGAVVDSGCPQLIENCENYGKAKSSNIAAGIVGFIRDTCTIKNCYNHSSAVMESNELCAAGGILGYVDKLGDVTIENCTNDGKCNSAAAGSGGIIGGIAGKATINDCKNTGEMKTTGAGGGIIGYVEETCYECINVNRCKNTGKIYVTNWASGGIVGNVPQKILIDSCENSGDVSCGNGNAGGILGSNGLDDTTINLVEVYNSVNRGYIHAKGTAGNPSVGGIVGSLQTGDSAKIYNCYNTGKLENTGVTSGYTYFGIGGIVGSIYDNATKTTTKSYADIKNSYNIGSITNTNNVAYAGQIIGRSFCSQTVTNSYGLNTIGAKITYGGQNVESNALKGYAGTLGSAYKNDESNINNGYPILNWE